MALVSADTAPVSDFGYVPGVASLLVSEAVRLLSAP
jgi:hypothetical protein